MQMSLGVLGGRLAFPGHGSETRGAPRHVRSQASTRVWTYACPRLVWPPHGSWLPSFPAGGAREAGGRARGSRPARVWEDLSEQDLSCLCPGKREGTLGRQSNLGGVPGHGDQAQLGDTMLGLYWVPKRATDTP